MTCCTKEIPGYYTMRIPSTSGEWHHTKDDSYFVPTATITLRAPLEEEDTVMAMLEEGLAGHYGQPSSMSAPGVTAPAPPPGMHAGYGAPVDTPPLPLGAPPPPPHSPLPQNWTETVDPASGESYYYNTATQVTQWDRPTGF